MLKFHLEGCVSREQIVMLLEAFGFSEDAIKDFFETQERSGEIDVDLPKSGYVSFESQAPIRVSTEKTSVLTPGININDIKADTIEDGINQAIHFGFSHNEILDWIINHAVLPSFPKEPTLPKPPPYCGNAKFADPRTLDAGWCKAMHGIIDTQAVTLHCYQNATDDEHEQWMDERSFLAERNNASLLKIARLKRIVNAYYGKRTGSLERRNGCIMKKNIRS